MIRVQITIFTMFGAIALLNPAAAQAAAIAWLLLIAWRLC